MGMAASALQIFEQFEMWENVITCYRVMGKDKKVRVHTARVRALAPHLTTEL